MKHLKLFETFNNRFKEQLIDGKYLYHYTLEWDLDNILEEGLLPNKNPNYKEGSDAVFLTNKNSLYNANLPQRLMDEQEEFYKSYENDEYDEEDKPIVKLVVDVSELNEDLFYPDDDYLENRYDWNKATEFEEQKIESLDIWGSIAYKGKINPKYIVSYNFNYFS